MSKSIRVHSRPWRLGPSTWGELWVNGVLPRVPKQLEPTEPCAPASLCTHIQWPCGLHTFRGGPKQHWRQQTVWAPASPLQVQRAPMHRELLLAIPCIRFPRNLDTSGSKSDNI